MTYGDDVMNEKARPPESTFRVQVSEAMVTEAWASLASRPDSLSRFIIFHYISLYLTVIISSSFNPYLLVQPFSDEQKH